MVGHAVEKDTETDTMAITFFHTLAGGMMLVLSTGKTDQLAWRFVRTIAVLVFAMGCGCGAWSILRPEVCARTGGDWVIGLGLTSALGAGMAVFLAPLADRIPLAFRSICGISGAAAVMAAAIAASANVTHEPPHRFATTVIIAGQAFGAFLIGSITIAWLLGHAYLTATKMTIALLRHFSRLLSLAVALRILYLLVSLAVAWWVSPDRQVALPGAETPLISQFGQAWLILILRIGVGLLAVGLFAYMVADCVRRRSTQSATGILYFGSVFSYVGELANLQLIQQYGWAL